MDDKYLYYILKMPYDNQLGKTTDYPVIRKISKDRYPFTIKFSDNEFEEGPFESIFELRTRSLIFASILSPKLKNRILKGKNITEILDFVITDPDKTYDLVFCNSLYHTLAGQISKGKAKGIHFYNPDKVRIIEKLNIDSQTGVYSAKIDLYDDISGCWISKDGITTFFPDYWTINKLFHECSYAFENMKKKEGSIKVYYGRTISGILVKFIIDDKGKITTFYPVLSDDEI